MIGITLNRRAMQRWLLAQSERSAVTRQCMVMAGADPFNRFNWSIFNMKTIAQWCIYNSMLFNRIILYVCLDDQCHRLVPWLNNAPTTVEEMTERSCDHEEAEYRDATFDQKPRDRCLDHLALFFPEFQLQTRCERQGSCHQCQPCYRADWWR